MNNAGIDVVYALVKLHKKNISLEEIAEKTPRHVFEKGMSIGELKNLLKISGLHYKDIFGDVQSGQKWLGDGVSLIVPVSVSDKEIDHFRLYISRKNDKYLGYNPPTTSKWVREEVFTADWGGYALAVSDKPLPLIPFGRLNFLGILSSYPTLVLVFFGCSAILALWSWKIYSNRLYLNSNDIKKQELKWKGKLSLFIILGCILILPAMSQFWDKDISYNTIRTQSIIKLEEPQVIKSIPEVFDFGEIPEGEEVNASFDLHNISEDAVKIIKTFSDCGCLVAEPTKKTIQPGESVEITATFNSKGKHGNSTTNVIIIYSSLGSANKRMNKMTLPISGKVLSLLRVKPNPFLLYNMHYGSKYTAKLLLESDYYQNLGIKNIEYSNDNLKNQIESTSFQSEPGKNEITFNLSPKTTMNSVESNYCMIEFEDDKIPDQKIKISWSISPVINVSPRAIVADIDKKEVREVVTLHLADNMEWPKYELKTSFENANLQLLNSSPQSRSYEFYLSRINSATNTDMEFGEIEVVFEDSGRFPSQKIPIILQKF